MEIVELICEMIYYVVYRRPMQIAQRRRRQDNLLTRRSLHCHLDSNSVCSKTADRSMTIESHLDPEDTEMIDCPLRR